MLDLLTTKHNGKMTLTLAFESATMQTQPRNDVCGGESLRSTIGRHSTDLFRAVGTRNAHASKGSLGSLGVGQWAQA